jgi:hypothetical protein
VCPETNGNAHTMAKDTTDHVPEGYDPDSEVARYFGVHVKSLKRWDKRPELNFPKAIEILGRKYRSRREYHEFAPCRCSTRKQANLKEKNPGSKKLRREGVTNMSDLVHQTNKCKPAAIDAAELIRAKRSSSAHFKHLLERYRKRGVTTTEIIAAMAASPLLIDAIGRGR